MLTSEIISILEKNGYQINDDVILRIETMLHSIKDDNKFHDLKHILEWFEKKRRESVMKIEEIGINELEKWNVSPKTGNIGHESGGFFEIIGIRVSNTVDREISVGWDQPIFTQKEGGILGILMKKFDGIPHYLLQAKAEPGNIGKLQLSPTLQATGSNLKQHHGGKKPLFAQYFEGENKGKIIYSKHQAEEGGRFYFKSNVHMIVEIDEEIELPPLFIWVTLFQIKQLLQFENIVNPHVRSIISVL